MHLSIRVSQLSRLYSSMMLAIRILHDSPTASTLILRKPPRPTPSPKATVTCQTLIWPDNLPVGEFCLQARKLLQHHLQRPVADQFYVLPPQNLYGKITVSDCFVITRPCGMGRAVDRSSSK